MLFQFTDRHRNFGLLILRVGIGAMFMAHGWPKLIGGPESWESLGKVMQLFSIGFGFTFWGFMAAVAEFGGGLLLLLGLFHRPACFFMFCTMAVAAGMHYADGDGFIVMSHAMESGILFLSLLLIGPGTHSLDHKFFVKE